MNKIAEHIITMIPHIPREIAHLIEQYCYFIDAYLCDMCSIWKKTEPSIYFVTQPTHYLTPWQRESVGWFYYCNINFGEGIACPDCCKETIKCDICAASIFLVKEDPDKFTCCDFSVCWNCYADSELNNHQYCPICVKKYDKS